MTPWPGGVIEMRHGVHRPHQLSIKLTAPAGAQSHALANVVRVAVYLTPVMARSSNLALPAPSTSHGNTFLCQFETLRHESVGGSTSSRRR